MRDHLKWLLFPGLNLHARLRNRVLPPHFGVSSNGHPRLVLDAGCGNGMLAYQSYLRGNRVIGISIKEGEIERNRRLFNGMLGIPEQQLEFRVHNLYDVHSLGESFDEIICTEVLEHIADDAGVARAFFDILRPGGVLHLCCPNAEHPDHVAHALDEQETGGHVRAGYTWQTYRALLEPIGFQLSEPIGLGGSFRQSANKRITAAQDLGGLPLGLIAFTTLAPAALLDRGQPHIPYSLYIKATKPATAAPANAGAST